MLTASSGRTMSVEVFAFVNSVQKASTLGLSVQARDGAFKKLIWINWTMQTTASTALRAIQKKSRILEREGIVRGSSGGGEGSATTAGFSGPRRRRS